jgi:toxin ParE1/3/4
MSSAGWQRMAAYSLSSKAAGDLEGIYEFSIDRFGLQQARTYLTGLSERFDAVAQKASKMMHGDYANRSGRKLMDCLTR